MKAFLTYFLVFYFSFSLFSRAGGGSSGGHSSGGFHSGSYGYSRYGHYGYYGPSASLTHNQVICLIICFLMLFLVVLIYAIRITYLYKNKGKINKDKLNERFLLDSFWEHEKIMNYTKEFYIELQNCWSKGDLNSMKHKLSPKLFNQYKGMLSRYKSRGLLNIVEDIDIKNLSVIYFDDYIDNSKDSIAILIEGELKDYFVHIGYTKNVEKQNFKDAFVFIRNNNDLILTEILNNPDFYQIAKPKTFIEK